MNKFSFVTYKVNKMNFAMLNPELNKNYNITPKISCSIKKAENNRTLGVMSIVIDNENNQSAVPFKLEIELVGVFNIEGDEAFVKSMLPRIAQTLLPYVRAILSMLTVSCNIPPYILPFVDFSTAKTTENPIKTNDENGLLS